jgi:hypothetical protein
MRRQTSTYRHIAVVCLGLALLAPMMYSFHFYGERLIHRMHMWYEAKHENLESFVVDSATIQWTKKNRELILHGEYFDVVSIKYKGGKATIKGVFDHKETEMHKAFAAATEKNKEKEHATQQLADWLQTGWFESQLIMTFAIEPFNSTYTTGFIHQFLPLRSLNIPHPPPWRLT